MDQRLAILNSIRKISERLGYEVLCADPEFSYSFDIVLKSLKEILIVKIVPNAGFLTEEGSRSLISFARFIDAYPLVLSLQNRNEKIEDGVVYTRHSLPIVSPGTFEDYLKDEEEPMVRAGPGGFYVSIDSAKLKKIREERTLSLGDIANALGTTRRTILMYESGMSASIETAFKMEEFLGEEIMSHVSFLWKIMDDKVQPNFKKMREFERLVNNELQKKGFLIYPFKKSILNFLMEDQESLFLGGIEEELLRFSRKMVSMQKLSEMTDMDSFLIVKKVREKPSKDTVPIIYYSELEEFQDKEEFKDVIRERRNI